MEPVWLKHYPAGVPAQIDAHRYPSLIALWDESVRLHGGRPCIANLGLTLRYAQVDKLSTQFAAFLQKHTTLQPGDRIAIQMPNLLALPIATLGALKAGLVVVNTNPLYTEREMEHQFRDSGAKAIVILDNFASKLEGVLAKTEIKHVIVTRIADLLPFPKGLITDLVVRYVKKMVPAYHLPGVTMFEQALKLGQHSTFHPVELTPDSLALLQYTGGTTGVAKGAMLTHGNLVANVEQIAGWIGDRLKPGREVIITAIPLYHIFAQTVNFWFFSKYGGLNVLITNPRDMPGFIKELGKWKFTCITGVNTLFNGLLNHPRFAQLDFSSLHLTVAGGMALQTAVAERWRAVTGVVLMEGYGLTEASPVTHFNPVDGRERSGSIGMPIPSTECAILDDDNQPLPAGERGELCIRGPQVMQGYWNRPDETAKTLIDGWLHTGDIATMDPDGYFRIVDRKKDMILVSGFNVYPNEVEDVLAAHPKVLEAAAIGIPDGEAGEAVKAFIVARDSSLTAAELADWCKENLTGYKRPKYYEFLKELPKSNVGKILRRPLRDAELAKLKG
jgi:long-chain acyl-CoA synthetase